MTLNAVRADAVKKLSGAGFTTPVLDVDCFLQHILNVDKTYILSHRDRVLTDAECSRLLEFVSKRETGLPVAYITGKKEFYGIEFLVTPDVLIPKPDTEILVEETLRAIAQTSSSANSLQPAPNASTAAISNETRGLKIADICTGSGCVGLSVLHSLVTSQASLGRGSLESLKLTMTDLSSAALEVAKKNYKKIFGDKSAATTDFLQGDLLCGRKGFDVIVSNPPYVPHAMVEELLLDGRSEPRLALDGDVDAEVSAGCVSDDGLAIIRRLVPMAFDALNEGGVFLMESGEYHMDKVRGIFESAGFKNIHTVKDLEGQERVTIGEKI